MEANKFSNCPKPRPTLQVIMTFIVQKNETGVLEPLEKSIDYAFPKREEDDNVGCLYLAYKDFVRKARIFATTKFLLEAKNLGIIGAVHLRNPIDEEATTRVLNRIGDIFLRCLVRKSLQEMHKTGV